jgi:hypothetical protein
MAQKVRASLPILLIWVKLRRLLIRSFDTIANACDAKVSRKSRWQNVSLPSMSRPMGGLRRAAAKERPIPDCVRYQAWPSSPAAAWMTRQDEMMAMDGGCACGQLRYRLTAQPFDAGYCHCRLCQLASAAPVMAFATVARADYVFLRGKPATWASSNFGERWFCPTCGTSTGMIVTHQPATIDFPIVTLDDPVLVVPGFHIWTRSRIGWFEIDDTMERHEKFRPDTAGLNAVIAEGAPLPQCRAGEAP